MQKKIQIEFIAYKKNILDLKSNQKFFYGNFLPNVNLIAMTFLMIYKIMGWKINENFAHFLPSMLFLPS